MQNSPYRPGPKQIRALQTLSKLEASAAQAIAIYGRDRFTTKDVADIAGVSIGTFYRYFPDRVAILARVAPVPSNVLIASDLISRALGEDDDIVIAANQLRDTLLACRELLRPENFLSSPIAVDLPRLPRIGDSDAHGEHQHI